jgi:hypothetical protein
MRFNPLEFHRREDFAKSRSLDIIRTVHRKGHVASDQRFADSHIREVKGPTCENP